MHLSEWPCAEPNYLPACMQDLGVSFVVSRSRRAVRKVEKSSFNDQRPCSSAGELGLRGGLRARECMALRRAELLACLHAGSWCFLYSQDRAAQSEKLRNLTFLVPMHFESGSQS